MKNRRTLDLAVCPALSLSHAHRFLVLALLAALGLISSAASAATVTWDASGNVTGGNATDGSGAWSTTGTNWDNGGSDSAWATGNDAVIGNNNGAAGTITVGSGISVDSITFNPPGSGAYTLSGGTITLTGSNIITNAAGVTINSVLAGSVGLTTSGTGTLTLTGVNTYTGTTNVTSGDLVVNFNGYGSGQFALVNLGAYSVASSGTLTLFCTANTAGYGGNQPDSFYTQSLTMAGAGTIVKSGTGYFDLFGGTPFASGAFTGTVNVSQGTLGIRGTTANIPNATLNVASGATFDLRIGTTILNIDQLTGSGTITSSAGGSNTLSVGNNNGNSTFAGSIQGGGSVAITKNGTGTFILSGANTYTGATIINSGVLQIGNGGGTGSLTSAVSGSSGATLAFDETGSMTFANMISGGLGLLQDGPGAVLLTTANSYTGGTTLSSGTLNIGADAELGGASGGITFAGAGTLQSGSNGLSLVSTRGITINNGVTGTIDTQGNNTTVNGVISGQGGLTKIGVGRLTLAGASTYSGATTLTSGTLNISGSETNSVVTVNGGILLASGSVGGAVIINNGGNLGGTGTVGGAVTVNGGGAINLTAGIGTLTLDNGLTIGNNSTASILDFEGSGGSFDLLNDSAGGLTVSGSAVIDITALANLMPGTYNLITFGSGSNLGGIYLGTPLVTGKNLSLLSTGTSEELVVAGASAYWVGGNGTSWNASPTTNWTADPAGTSPTSVPTSTTDVYFNANGITGPLTTSLGANFDINSLNFTSGATGGVTISDGTYGLTLESGGIVVNSGAGAVMISATGVAVDASQVWVNNSSSLLTVTSPIAGTAASGTTTLTVNGAGSGGFLLGGAITDGTAGGSLALLLNGSGGTAILGANNSYSGGTTLSSGTLQVGNGGTAGTLGSGAVTDNGTLVFNRSDSPTISNLIGGSGALVQAGGGTLILTASNTYSGGTTISAGTLQLGDGISNNGYVTGNITDKAMLVFANPISQTYNSVVSGSGGLTKSGAGLLTMGGANTYTGSTTVSSGTTNVIGSISASSPVVIGSNGSTGATLEITAAQTLASLTTGSGAAGSSLIYNPSGTQFFNVTGAVTLNSPLTITKVSNGAWAVFEPNGGITGNGGGAGNDSLIFSNLGGAQMYIQGEPGTYNFAGNVHFLTDNGQQYVWQGNDIIPSTSSVTIDSGAVVNQSDGATAFNIDGLNGAGTWNGSGGALTVGSAGGSGTFSGVIGSSWSLVKTGTGTQVLSGANTYSGGTTINSGDLLYDASARSGLLTYGANSIASTGTLTLYDTATTVDNTYIENTTITGTGTLAKTGAGYLDILNGSNFSGFAGTINVQAGTLGVNGIGANASAPAMTLNIGSGANFDDRAAVNLVMNQLTGSGTLGTSYSQALTVSIGNDNGSSTFAGSIVNGLAVPGATAGGTIAITKSGTGTLTFTGANTYTGSTIINAGTLQIGNGGTTGSLAASSAISGSAGGALVYDLSSSGTVGNSIGGGINFTQAGSGTLKLSNASYSGNTTVTGGGTLIVAGNISGNAVVTGGTLGVVGTIGGNLTVGNNLGAASSSVINVSLGDTTPGNNNALTVNGNVTLNSDAQFQFTLNSTAGTSDYLNVPNGTLTLGGSIAGIDAGNTLLPTNGTAQFFIGYAADGITGTFNGVPENGLIEIGQNYYSVDYGITDPDYLVLTAAVPEPGTWGMMLGGLGLLVAFQQRRHSKAK